jgi:hypothetical protein
VKLSLVALFALIAALLTLPTWQTRTTGPAVGMPAVAGRLPSVPGAPARGVFLADGLLSVDAAEVDVAALLAEVARQAGFEFHSSMAAPDPISLRFDHLPLDKGLLQILSGQRYTLAWIDPNAAPGARRPLRLWMLGPQAVPDAPPSAPSPIGTTAPTRPDPAELLAALRAGTPPEREQAAADLGQLGRDGSVATQALAAALADGAARVRLAAIESLATIGGVDAALALEMALRDPAPRVREAAVDALGEIGGSTSLALLEQARADPVDYVRQAAIEAIERLRLPARRARP